MKILANGCRYSGIKVLPKNWKTTTSVRKNWQIYYRFYADGLTGPGTKYPKGKQVVVRGMNEYKTIEDRRDSTKALIQLLEGDLEKRDYNPVTGYIRPPEPEFIHEIDPSLPFIDALQVALQRKQVINKTTLKSVLKYTALAIKALRYDTIAIKDITRRHMKAVMAQCGAMKGRKWTAHCHNSYRSHLMMLFEELCEWEAINGNPMIKISTQKEVRKKRATLTKEQRRLIDVHLKADNYKFWRFMQIFFHSGSRETEIMMVRREDIDLERQQIKYTILKGRVYREEYGPIKTIALPYWLEAIEGAKPNQYIFGEGLQPRDKPIRADQITRRWKKWVKDRVDKDGNKVYGENVADFYSLKHSNTTETVSIVGTRLAAQHNKHTEAVLKRNYDVEGEDRDMEMLKAVDNEFSQVKIN